MRRNFDVGDKVIAIDSVWLGDGTEKNKLKRGDSEGVVISKKGITEGHNSNKLYIVELSDKLFCTDGDAFNSKEKTGILVPSSETIGISKDFTTFATLNSSKKVTFFDNFGIHPKHASAFGKKVEDVYQVKFKISEDQSLDEKVGKMEPDYWGFFSYESMRFSLIYAKRFLLNICFPSGIKGCENAYQGKSYRLEILEYTKFTDIEY